uniref:Nbas_N domain-containing protein n=1 Tax=Rhodnius prolixus TaxID=13249 RepID=T1IFZ5_RHOPR
MASFCSALEYDEQPVFMPDQFYELMVYSEWRQDPDSWANLLKRTCEHLEKPDNSKKTWLSYYNKKKKRAEWPARELISYWSLLLPWLISISPNGKYVALLQDTVLEIRRAKEQYSNVMGRGTVRLLYELLVPTRQVWDCLGALKEISDQNKVFQVWVPGHSADKGNEVEDLLARESSAGHFVGPETCFGVSKCVKSADVNLWVQVPKEKLSQCRKMVWSPDSVMILVSSSEGIVYVYDIVGFHMFTICSPTPVSKDITRFVVGLECVNSPFKSAGWEFVLFVVYTDGMVYLYNISSQEINNFVILKTCVAKMQISPKSHWLAALHCCGSIRIWHIPGLRKEESR